MKRTVIGFLSIIASLFAFAGGFNGPFLLDGKVDEIKTGIVIISYDIYLVDRWVTQSDTAPLKDGIFRFNGTIDEPKKCRIEVGSISTSFYIDANNMTVRLFSKSPDSVVVVGSRTQVDNERLNKMVGEKEFLFNQSITSWSKVEGDSSKLSKAEWQIVRDKWLRTIDSLSFDRYVVRANFVKSNSSSFISLLYLNSLMSIGWTNLITTKQARELFNNYPKEFQNGSTGKWGDKLIKQRENIEIGAIAPDFCVNDWHGKQFRLSDLRGKYVLIDVWASWCGPCIANFPEIMSLFKKYHSKGFEVLAVSKDYTVDNWITGIHKFGLEEWHHVMGMKSPEKFWKQIYDNDDIVENYPMKAIPVKILIDKEGKIIGTWGFGENTKPLDELLDTIFTSIP